MKVGYWPHSATALAAFLVILFQLLVHLKHSAAEIIKYKQHLIQSDRPEYIVIPKFQKDEVPHWKPGNGDSYIDLSGLKIHASCNPKEAKKLPPEDLPEGEYCKSTVFDVLFFEAPSDPSKSTWMDHWKDGAYCCTDAVLEDGGCTSSQYNRLIVPESLKSAYARSVVIATDETSHIFDADSEVTRHFIDDTGLYVLMMALCDPFSYPIVIDGAVESLDPYGYVPPNDFGNLPYYMALTAMYVIVAITWLLLCVMYRDQIMPLQYWISGVIAIALMESCLMLWHYSFWNSHGSISAVILALALTFGAIKRAGSRVLVLLVALGYGVVKPSLGEDMNRVLFLGVSYLAMSFTYSLMTHLRPPVRSVNDPDYDLISLLVFLTAVVDTTFYVWIFTSISNLLVSLAARKQGVKYLLYRNFRNVLIALLLFTCAWVFYSSVIFLNDNGGENVNWRFKWTVDALWELIYFIIFVSIAVLWAPSNNAQRYAHSMQLSQLEDDDEFNSAVEMAAVSTAAAASAGDEEMDEEYGGRLQDDQDPFQGTGALDPAMATQKKA